MNRFGWCFAILNSVVCIYACSLFFPDTGFADLIVLTVTYFIFCNFEYKIVQNKNII